MSSVTAKAAARISELYDRAAHLLETGAIPVDVLQSRFSQHTVPVYCGQLAAQATLLRNQAATIRLGLGTP